MAITSKVKATAGDSFVVGQAAIIETDEKGQYIAKRLMAIGREAATATEDIKVGDRLVVEGEFLRKAVGDEWSKLP